MARRRRPDPGQPLERVRPRRERRRRVATPCLSRGPRGRARPRSGWTGPGTPRDRGAPTSPSQMRPSASHPRTRTRAPGARCRSPRPRGRPDPARGRARAPPGLDRLEIAAQSSTRPCLVGRPEPGRLGRRHDEGDQPDPLADASRSRASRQMAMARRGRQPAGPSPRGPTADGGCARSARWPRRTERGLEFAPAVQVASPIATDASANGRSRRREAATVGHRLAAVGRVAPMRAGPRDHRGGPDDVRAERLLDRVGVAQALVHEVAARIVHDRRRHQRRIPEGTPRSTRILPLRRAGHGPIRSTPRTGPPNEVDQRHLPVDDQAPLGVAELVAEACGPCELVPGRRRWR